MAADYLILRIPVLVPKGLVVVSTHQEVVIHAANGLLDLLGSLATHSSPNELEVAIMHTALLAHLVHLDGGGSN